MTRSCALVLLALLGLVAAAFSACGDSEHADGDECTAAGGFCVIGTAGASGCGALAPSDVQDCNLEKAPGGAACCMTPANCYAQPENRCGAGFTAFYCTGGFNPEPENPGLACTKQSTDSNQIDHYCCFAPVVDVPDGGPTCLPDESLTVPCADGTFGFVCNLDDDLTSYGTSLTCSAAGETFEGQSGFCCVYGTDGGAGGGN